MSDRRFAAAELRDAATAIAREQHPDQSGEAPRHAFDHGQGFVAVRMTGGTVLITREQAEQKALTLREANE